VSSEDKKTQMVKNLRATNISSKGHNLALTVLCVPHSLDSGMADLTPESIKFNRFLKLILLEHKPLWACFGFVKRQKWLVSRKINLRQVLNLIDSGVKDGAREQPDQPGIIFSVSLLSSLELRGKKIYEPEKRARLGTTAHFCEVVVLQRTRYHQPPEWFEILFFGLLVCSGPRRNPA
jgi:hypothetical protein